MRRSGRGLRGWMVAMAAAAGLAAQGIPSPGPLRPGEGLVICAGEAPPRCFGEVTRPSPLGELARLPWLKLVGTEWGSLDVRFRCTGGPDPFPCGGPKGHGKVDLGAALRKGCDRALLAWSTAAMARWQQEVGGSVARLQLLEVFGRFLGRRLPPGDGLPVLTPAWVGRGDLLQSSPADLAAWLQDPLQMDLLASLQRYGSGYFVDVKVLLGREGWWILPATSPGAGAWVVAGQGDLFVVFRIPSGRGEVEGLGRLKAVLGVS